MTTLLLLLAGDPATFRVRLEGVDVPGATWVGCQAADDPLAQTEYGARTPFAALVAAEVPAASSDDPLAAAGPVVEALGDTLDRSRSSALVGTTHPIVEGRTDVALVYAIHRIPGITVDQYQDHWLHRHGPLAKVQVPTEGYLQTHTDHGASADVAAALSFGGDVFDGVATCFFGSRDDFVAMLDKRQGERDANAIYVDELRFLDHARSFGALMRRTPG